MISRNVIFERAKLTLLDAAKRVRKLICLLLPCTHSRTNQLSTELFLSLKDSTLAEELQLDPDLALAKAINQARQSEAVKK